MVTRLVELKHLALSVKRTLGIGYHFREQGVTVCVCVCVCLCVCVCVWCEWKCGVSACMVCVGVSTCMVCVCVCVFGVNVCVWCEGTYVCVCVCVCMCVGVYLVWIYVCGVSACMVCVCVCVHACCSDFMVGDSGGGGGPQKCTEGCGCQAVCGCQVTTAPPGQAWRQRWSVQQPSSVLLAAPSPRTALRDIMLTLMGLQTVSSVLKVGLSLALCRLLACLCLCL